MEYLSLVTTSAVNIQENKVESSVQPKEGEKVHVRKEQGEGIQK